MSEVLTYLGIKENIIDRAVQISDPQVTIEKIGPEMYAVESLPPYSAAMRWERSGETAGGLVEFRFAQSIDRFGISIVGSPTILTSYMQINGAPLTHPTESLSAFLTTIHSINEAAEKIPGGISHLGRANQYTNGYFTKLTEAGLYSYCDLNLHLSALPFRTLAGDILYLGRYPSRLIRNRPQFVNEKLSKAIERLYHIAIIDT